MEKSKRKKLTEIDRAIGVLEDIYWGLVNLEDIYWGLVNLVNRTQDGIKYLERSKKIIEKNKTKGMK